MSYESCQPCGDCVWCKTNFRARRQRKQFRALLKEAAFAIHDELYAAGPDEVAQHPMFQKKDRLLKRIKRALNNQ